MKKKHNIRLNTTQCIGCGLCRKDCPTDNIVIENKKAKLLSQDCIMCGHCVAVCPKAAVSITGFDTLPEEINRPTVLDPQRFLDAIKTRRSIRQFKNTKVSSEILKQIIEAGRLTPTGGNAQEVSFIVLQKGLKQYEKMAVQLFRRLFPLMKLVIPMAKRMVIDEHFFFKQANAAIVIVSKNNEDGMLAAGNMELMAQACGLGVLYSGFFTMAVNMSRTLRRMLGIKRGEKAVMTLVLGYSNVTYFRTVQKEEATVRYL